VSLRAVRRATELWLYTGDASEFVTRLLRRSCSSPCGGGDLGLTGAQRMGAARGVGVTTTSLMPNVAGCRQCIPSSHTAVTLGGDRHAWHRDNSRAADTLQLRGAWRTATGLAAPEHYGKGALTSGVGA
jgi:hypothetical protein